MIFIAKIQIAAYDYYAKSFNTHKKYIYSRNLLLTDKNAEVFSFSSNHLVSRKI